MTTLKGYRVLSEQETALANEGKELAEKVGRFIEKLRAERDPTVSGDPLVADQRWVAIGATQLQQGFMALTRSITKPTTF